MLKLKLINLSMLKVDNYYQFFVIIATVDKPEITGIREIHIMQLNAYINLTSSSKTSSVYTI